MGKSFILNDYGENKIHTCPSRFCGMKNGNEKIPTYYSEYHASDMGWVKTSDIKFCMPELDYVWVCPDCIARVNNLNKDKSICA